MEQNEGSGTAKPPSRDKESVICLYPSKRCDNLRATKPNGQLHKFCQLHREKANYNQRQMLYKRRHEQQPPTQEIQIEFRGPQLLPKPPANNQLIDDEFELDEEHIRLIEEVASANVEDTAHNQE
eukprot:jgi/Phyca11/108838/e_gw1.15.604.1